ncbi:MAG: hypothetical protein WAO08_15535 [Hyphomicrobiaceae bacterium]
MSLRFLERLDAGLGTFELEPQGVALTLKRRQFVGRGKRLRRFHFAALRLRARSGSLPARSIPAAWGHRINHCFVAPPEICGAALDHTTIGRATRTVNASQIAIAPSITSPTVGPARIDRRALRHH